MGRAASDPLETADFFRRQARRFAQLAAESTDPTIVRHLKEVAEDFRARADALARDTQAE